MRSRPAADSIPAAGATSATRTADAAGSLGAADEELRALAARVCNWGRWGPDDELGTVNHIDEAARLAGVAEVRTGEALSLSLPYRRNGLQPPGDRRLDPQHTMLQTGTDLRAGVQAGAVGGWGYSDDMVTMALQCSTHWDSLAHAFHDYKMYNDRPCELVSAAGAERNAIDVLQHKLATRGVLLDVAEAFGLSWLEPGRVIDVDDLERAAEALEVEVRQGDVVLVRTGAIARARASGSWEEYSYSAEAGLAPSVLPWLDERRVAAVATDNWACEVLPSNSSIMLPLHAVGIVYMGLVVGENFDLDELARRCRADGRYGFLFVAAPLPFERAVGGPVNPMVLR